MHTKERLQVHSSVQGSFWLGRGLDSRVENKEIDARLIGSRRQAAELGVTPVCSGASKLETLGG